MPKALIITAEGFEDIELLYPYYRLQEAGYETHIATPAGKPVRGKMGYEANPVLSLKEVDPKDYDILVLPGGRGPERVRLYCREEARRIVSSFIEDGKPVAAICHGPQLIVTAGKASGRRLTSYPGIRDDLEAAGANWVDEPVVVDGSLVTSRVPPDIPLWMREFIRIAEKYVEEKNVGA
ncbi:MAG: type 1 glutamine amidotransferase [Desulfurococcales archaeon]|nr:type 1 glutamine amidotransferase [Desulfurococcales archaeon]